jgi:WD40 repeat protein
LKVTVTRLNRCGHSDRGHQSMVYSVAFHPTAPLLATGSRDNTAELWHYMCSSAVSFFSFF